eukprot:1153415-Karenia_brevis.AAC.1
MKSNFRQSAKILCVYAAQKRLLQQRVRRSDMHVVDACQGSEFDASTIVSAGGHDGKVGFLKDRRRVNVAFHTNQAGAHSCHSRKSYCKRERFIWECFVAQYA